MAVADHSCCWGSDAAEVDSCSVAGGFESNEVVGIRTPALASLVTFQLIYLRPLVKDF